MSNNTLEINSHNFILIIGPSGCGKTSLIKHLSLIDGISTISLDEDLSQLIKREFNLSIYDFISRNGSDVFCRLAIKYLENQHALLKNICVVDVGAGFLESDSVFELLRMYSSITLWVNPNESYRRFMTKNLPEKFKNRDLGEYVNTEFSERRERIYKSTSIFCDTTNMSTEETFVMLRDCIFSRPPEKHLS